MLSKNFDAIKLLVKTASLQLEAASASDDPIFMLEQLQAAGDMQRIAIRRLKRM